MNHPVTASNIERFTHLHFVYSQQIETVTGEARQILSEKLAEWSDWLKPLGIKVF
jgi:hypothetical protein